MKIIDLLNKIANGEDVPKKIKYENRILYLEDEADEYPPTFNYYDKDGNNALFEGWIGQYLNDEVEIIEEEPKVQVELTEKEYLEYLDKQIEYMEKVKNYKPNPSYLSPKEEKKIPEKLDKNDFLDNETLEQVDEDLDFIIDKINEIIDYLKSKGK